MKDIVIIGSGGMGREVAWLIEEINQKNKTWKILGYLESKKENVGQKKYNYQIIGDLSYLDSHKCNVICAIGDSKTRKKIIQDLIKYKITYATLIHPSVIFSESVCIGEGSIVFANSILTTNIEIGKHVFISLNSLISHDTTIRDYSTVLPGCRISGNVYINECVTVGTGSTIIQGIKIGKNAFLGAGTVVISDIVENKLVVGVPAKEIKNF